MTRRTRVGLLFPLGVLSGVCCGVAGKVVSAGHPIGGTIAIVLALAGAVVAGFLDPSPEIRP